MIQRCLEDDRRFGVVLIREERETRGPAMPSDIGTVAYITDVESFDDGRMNLLTRGTDRFRIIDHLERDDCLTGIVEVKPDAREESHPQMEALQRRIVDIFPEYQAGLMHLLGESYGDEPLPDIPRELAYFVAARLRVSWSRKQKLLELPSTMDLLSTEIAILEAETERHRSLLRLEKRLRQSIKGFEWKYLSLR